MEEILAPITQALSTTRNTTELSQYCESIVRTFISKKRPHARIVFEKADYDHDALYKGIKSVCRRNEFKNCVSIHKQNGQLILLRKDIL